MMKTKVPPPQQQAPPTNITFLCFRRPHKFQVPISSRRNSPSREVLPEEFLILSALVLGSPDLRLPLSGCFLLLTRDFGLLNLALSFSHLGDVSLHLFLRRRLRLLRILRRHAYLFCACIFFACLLSLLSHVLRLVFGHCFLACRL